MAHPWGCYCEEAEEHDGFFFFFLQIICLMSFCVSKIIVLYVCCISICSVNEDGNPAFHCTLYRNDFAYDALKLTEGKGGFRGKKYKRITPSALTLNLTV